VPVKELSITQSAVSRHIRTLEEHFACRLFVRSGRSLQLTEAARVLLPVCVKALRRWSGPAIPCAGKMTSCG
jgi:transcriptional regulator, LysR family